MTPQEQEVAKRDLVNAVSALQESAYANFRSTVAFAAMFFGGFSVFLIAVGEIDAARAAPTALWVLGGLLGVGHHVARQRRPLATYLLIAAFASMLLGLAGQLVVA
jgi:hypothetical protein